MKKKWQWRCSVPVSMWISSAFAVACNALFGLAGTPVDESQSADSSTSTIDAGGSAGDGAGSTPDVSSDVALSDQSDDGPAIDGPDRVDNESGLNEPDGLDGWAGLDGPDGLNGADGPTEGIADGLPDGEDRPESDGETALPCSEALPSRIVLFGGNDGGTKASNDTWEWDGTGWAQEPTALSPPLAWSGAMAAICGKAILVGGGSSISSGPDQTEQWAWDGINWTSSTLAPPPRENASAASLLGTIVLFGGLDANSAATQDTWIWNRQGWTPVDGLAPSSLPPARSAAAMAALGDYVLLFGGSDSSSNPLNDTWIWNGVSWMQQHPLVSPSPRMYAAVAALRNSVVLFGGLDETFESLDETWVWDSASANWTNPMPAASPSKRISASAASFGDQVILFGGETAEGTVADTWNWDGTNWTPVTVPGLSPPARYGAVMASF